MNKKYNLVFIITVLLFMLSISITWINYNTAITATRNHIIKQLLPLSLDNVYSDIQKSIIEPYILTSSMGSNVFVKRWLLRKDKDKNIIFDYLSTFKEQYQSYNVYTTFLVDVRTKTYYKPYGEYFQLSKEHLYDKWYFKFLNSGRNESITLNLNVNRELTLYYNTAIFDDNHNLIGITGIGLRYPYIDRLFKHFKNKHDIRISFYNENSKLIMSELVDGVMPKQLYQQDFVENMIKEHKYEFEYYKDSVNYFLRMKYIPELDSYIVVESKIDDFITGIKQSFYINVLISIIISAFILIIVISVIRKNQKQMEYLANKDPLTKLSNRRHFIHQFQNCFDLSKRNNMALSLLFLDLDDFKVINDSLGHEVGDKVLKRVSSIFATNTRKTDFIGRWGGEEFVILFTNTDIKKAEKLAEKLCQFLQKDKYLMTLLKKPQTGSFGVTQVLQEDENINIVVARADKAMYNAKKQGKNGVVISPEFK